MLTHCSMFWFHREWILPFVFCKRLLYWIFLCLGPAWIQNIKLLGFCFHINNVVGKAVEDIVIGVQTDGYAIDWGLVWRVLIIAVLLLIYFELPYRCEWIGHSLGFSNFPAWGVRELGDTCFFAQALINFIVTWAWPSVVLRHILRILDVELELGSWGAPSVGAKRRRILMWSAPAVLCSCIHLWVHVRIVRVSIACSFGHQFCANHGLHFTHHFWVWAKLFGAGGLMTLSISWSRLLFGYRL